MRKFYFVLFIFAVAFDALVDTGTSNVFMADFGASAIIAIIMAAAGIAASGAAAGKAAKAKNEQRKKQGIINEQDAYNESLLDKEYYQDWSKRTEIQNAMRQLEANQRQADARSTTKGAIMGATPEQQLAAQEINRSAYANSLAQIASNASMLRDQALRDKMGAKNRTYAQRLGMQDQLAAIDQNEANQWANAANTAFAGAGYMAANALGGIDVSKKV